MASTADGGGLVVDGAGAVVAGVASVMLVLFVDVESWESWVMENRDRDG
jgi:hypothetical protein